MGVTLQHAAIHERAGVALVGVANDILHVAVGLGHCCPLQAGGVAAAAPAAQAAGDDLVNHVVGRQLGDGLHQGRVAVTGDVLFDALRVDQAAVFQHDLFLAGEERYVGGQAQPLNRLRLQRGDDVGHVVNFDVLIEHFARLFGVYRHQRPGGAQTHAARAADATPALQPLALNFLVQRLFNHRTLGGHTAGGHAHVHRVGITLGHLLFHDGDFLKLVEHDPPPRALATARWPRGR